MIRDGRTIRVLVSKDAPSVIGAPVGKGTATRGKEGLALMLLAFASPLCGFPLSFSFLSLFSHRIKYKILSLPPFCAILPPQQNSIPYFYT